MFLQVVEKFEESDHGKRQEEKKRQADSSEQSKMEEDKEQAVNFEQQQQCKKIVEKVEVGVQHDGFFETSFEFSPSEDLRQETKVSEGSTRKDWGSQTPFLQTQDWSGQIEAGKVDFGVQVELSGEPTIETQCQTELWQRTLSSEEVDVDALLEEEENEKEEESMMSMVNLLEVRVKELEGLLEKERRTKVTSRMRRVEDWKKELEVVRLALQIALEDSNLARLELEATKESRSMLEAGFLEESRRWEEEVREKVKDSEERRRNLEVELEVAVSESAGLREQVIRMELRIEELEAEVCNALHHKTQTNDKKWVKVYIYRSGNEAGERRACRYLETFFSSIQSFQYERTFMLMIFPGEAEHGERQTWLVHTWTWQSCYCAKHTQLWNWI